MYQNQNQNQQSNITDITDITDIGDIEEYNRLLLLSRYAKLSKFEEERLIKLSTIYSNQTNSNQTNSNQTNSNDSDNNNSINYRLIDMIKEDTSISQIQRDILIDKSNLFLSDLEVNLPLTTIRLSKKYPTYSPDDWRDFLSYPLVNRYLIPFRNEILSSQMDQIVEQGKATAATISLKHDLDKSSKQVNSQIVVFRLPIKQEGSNRYV